MDAADRALLTRLLQQVRSEFDHLRWQSRPVQAQLVHRATNAEAEGVRGMPKPNQGMLAMAGAGHREGGTRLDENGNPLFRDDPIVDVNGNPIVNSAGDAFDFVMPAFRSVMFSGRGDDYSLLAGIAERAGRVTIRLGDLPVLSALSGWQFSTPADLWWALLFEIAWAKQHPLLFADKRLWVPEEEPSTFVPYDLRQLNALTGSGFGFGSKIPENWLKRLPDAWVSELNDVVAASVDVTDYLLSALGYTEELVEGSTSDDSPHEADDSLSSPSTIARDINTSQENSGDTSTPPSFVTDKRRHEQPVIRRRFAIALSFPGERREFVNEVATALSGALGEPRVFYDKFHEEELACANLDLKLQRIYAEDADLVAVFVCGEYEKKEWCGLEWGAVRSLMMSHSRPDEDVMFLRFDDKPLEGLLRIHGYLDIAGRSAREVADALIKRWSATR